MSAVVIPVRPETADREAARARDVLDQMFAYYTPEPAPVADAGEAEYDLVA